MAVKIPVAALKNIAKSEERLVFAPSGIQFALKFSLLNPLIPSRTLWIFSCLALEEKSPIIVQKIEIKTKTIIVKEARLRYLEPRSFNTVIIPRIIIEKNL